MKKITVDNKVHLPIWNYFQQSLCVHKYIPDLKMRSKLDKTAAMVFMRKQSSKINCNLAHPCRFYLFWNWKYNCLPNGKKTQHIRSHRDNQHREGTLKTYGNFNPNNSSRIELQNGQSNISKQSLLLSCLNIMKKQWLSTGKEGLSSLILTYITIIFFSLMRSATQKFPAPSGSAFLWCWICRCVSQPLLDHITEDFTHVRVYLM